MNNLQCTLTIIFGILALFHQGHAITCSICDTEVDGWECLSKPPLPVQCPGFDFCINVAKYSIVGKLKTITRSCSPFDVPGGDVCLPGVDNETGETVQICYNTCSQDGCNGGNQQFHHLIDFLRKRRK